jgi:hypothetical protein
MPAVCTGSAGVKHEPSSFLWNIRIDLPIMLVKFLVLSLGSRLLFFNTLFVKGNCQQNGVSLCLAIGILLCVFGRPPTDRRQKTEQKERESTTVTVQFIGKEQQ